VEGLYRERGGGPEYASLHPLFGPLGCPAGETVAVVPLRLERWRERLEKLLTGLGLVYTYVSVEEHDKAMAVNQVLHHLVYEVLGEAMERLRERLGVEPGLLKSLATYSLRQTLSVMARLERLQAVVEEIRRLNPYAGDAVEALAEVVEEKARLLGRGSSRG
ncbi:MAG: prephenate dehydrogenase/arogenate dehydrogenase family protein, partial [Crenarchaeota archaeon]|nr:prephenate dehydrogenase/arogenate dehydrogenase family protein [Thermoproteota archaeon]